jgi:hypothetical protein
LFIQQPALRAIFSFNFCYYLKEKFVAHPFVNSKWRELRMKQLNMSLPTREARMQEVRTRTNLLHPLILRALKGNEHQSPKTQITFHNNQYMIIRN